MISVEARSVPLSASCAFVLQLTKPLSSVQEGREPEASDWDVRRTMVALEAVWVTLGLRGPVRPADAEEEPRGD